MLPRLRRGGIRLLDVPDMLPDRWKATRAPST
jgi:hypothetical protein